ncbi:MAG: hypothetical protein WAM07_06635, partial [Halobacillus sp.]|uniref:hypothetical protein n=1 Tax=Halobacillus sp. TaxID=56800 RepID=UPI003BB05E45
INAPNKTTLKSLELLILRSSRLFITVQLKVVIESNKRVIAQSDRLVEDSVLRHLWSVTI